MRCSITFLALFSLLTSGCDQLGLESPKTLEECLLRAADKDSAAAISAAQNICEKVFSGYAVEAGRELFYITDAPICQVATLDDAGKASFTDDRFCGDGSRLENSDSDGLTLTCLSYRKQGVTRIFAASVTPTGLELSDGGRPEAILYATLAGCERRRLRDSPASVPAPAAETEIEPVAEATSEPTSEPTPQPTPEPKPVAEPAPAPAPRPAAAPAPMASPAVRGCCGCLTSKACLRSGDAADCTRRLASDDWGKVNTMCLDEKCGEACADVE